jgi:NAD(P)H-dependent FMN reductase
MGQLPLFNPDLDQFAFAPVNALREKLRAADGVLIASPEYAHGITGVMKNALDWMVNDEALVFKPVALFNASPRASHAQASLREVLQTVSARIIDAASIDLPVIGSQLDAQGIAADPALSAALRAALLLLVAEIPCNDKRTDA